MLSMHFNEQLTMRLRKS